MLIIPTFVTEKSDLMNRIYNYLILTVLGSLTLASCAKEVVESSDEIEKKVIDAYVSVVHKDTIHPTASGIYIIREKIGDGMGVENDCGVYVRYSITDLKDHYSTTSYEDVAKQLGTYSKSTYYGPVLWEVGYYTIIQGVEEALLTMRVGGKIKVIVPSWMSKFGYDGSSKEHTTPTIYEIEVVRVVKDLQVYLADTLSAYKSYHWGNEMDTISSDYYFKKLKAGEGDTLAKGDAVNIWYVGKLLDGFVFDTNIEDTARKYGIYSSSNTYTALSHTLADTSTSSTDNAVVKGFEISLWRMSHGGEAVTFFSPSLGYGSESQSFGLYQPLLFYIKVAKE